MRAAVGCLSFASDSERSFLLDSYSSCHNALFSFYAKEESGFCIQSRDEDGEVSDTIPAVPDADPNYHTGLPLIFCIERLGNFSVSSS
jgi:mannose/cellobiose epimerase-like protein (N-acyl-D-glucosamine 2-epimerase family)